MLDTAQLNPQLAEWLDDTARGDRLAFEKIYRATASHLFALALRILKRQDWAEEALQDSFLKIWHKSEAYHPEKGRAFSWMVTIVRNRCIDQWRKVKREPLSKTELSEEGQAIQDTKALHQLEYSAEGPQLKRCLQNLSEEERSAVLLTYWQGFSNTELAAQMERPLGTVKTWVRRALVSLRECLGV